MFQERKQRHQGSEETDLSVEPSLAEVWREALYAVVVVVGGGWGWG